MNLNQLDIIVSNVPQVCADLEHILDKKADYADDGFAQFTIGSHCLMLSQNHLVPLENFQSGIIIHIEVEDVDQNYKRLNELGIKGFTRTNCNRLGNRVLISSRTCWSSA